MGINTLNALPEVKQKALHKLKPEGTLLASLAGYALLQQGLQKLGLKNLSLSDIQFPHHMKPFFPQGPDFNISHSHKRIVCAISSDVQVGVDIEKVVSLDNYRLKHYFHEEELTYIQENKERFYEVWTKKEAVLKATGNAGLAQAKQIKFYGPYALFAQIKWHLHAFEWDDYCIAVASSQEREIEWFDNL